jgi:regulator of nucleoside diphosphate kinase
MKAREIYITEHDMERLRKLIDDERRAAGRERNGFKELEAELDRARVVRAEDVPSGVITMDSQVRLVDLDTDEDMVCTLVYPDDADADLYKISVLAPIGTAMLGYSVGDTFEWEVPAGVRRLKVEEILYQPEAAGESES